MSYNPHIGEMDRKVTIVSLIKTQTVTGADVVTDSVIANPFAKMFEVSASENVDGKVRLLLNRKYVIRYNAQVVNLANKLVLIDDNIRFNIESVKIIGRKKHIEISVNDYE